MTIPGSPVSLITLTTDFGLSDPFVGVMKGVIYGINPQATVIDLTHQVPPQNRQQGAFVLGSSYRYFPAGAIHAAVVDPGVGTDRRPVLLVTPDARFIAPDNGLLSRVLEPYLTSPPDTPGQTPLPAEVTAYELTNPACWLHPVSSTFHGRDIFAPAAAHLSLGAAPTNLGEPVTSLVWLPAPRLTRRKGEALGEIIYTDRFGNLIANIGGDVLPELAGPDETLAVEICGRRIIGLSRTFQDVSLLQPDGLPLAALIGSSGYLEIAVRDGNAAAALNAGPGTAVRAVNAGAAG